MVPGPHAAVSAATPLPGADSKLAEDALAELTLDACAALSAGDEAQLVESLRSIRELVATALAEKARVLAENVSMREAMTALNAENAQLKAEVESLRASKDKTQSRGEVPRSAPHATSKSVATASAHVDSVLAKVSAESQLHPDAKVVFVTGAAGFIGFHTALRLHARGDVVLGLDNYNDYYSVQLKRDRAAMLAAKGISVITGDICDMGLVSRILSGARVSHVVHLAAQAGVRFAVEQPLTYIRANVQGFVTVLEAIRLENQASGRDIKIAYASSSSVYGLNTKTPFAETDVVDRPASLYGATKKSNEEIAHAYNHVHGLAVTGLRFFTVYGPYGRPDMAIYTFTRDIVSGKQLTVFRNNDGSELLRDFTYVDDIVTGIVGAVDLGARCEIFNLGNSAPQTVTQLIENIERATGKKASVEYKTVYGGDVSVTFADVAKAKEHLGYVPTTSLSDGVEKFVAWYCDYHRVPSRLEGV